MILETVQAPKNQPSDCPGCCLKLRGCIHTVPMASDRTDVFSGHPRKNPVPKLKYFKTQSYLVLSLLCNAKYFTSTSVLTAALLLVLVAWY